MLCFMSKNKHSCVKANRTPDYRKQKERSFGDAFFFVSGKEFVQSCRNKSSYINNNQVIIRRIHRLTPVWLQEIEKSYAQFLRISVWQLFFFSCQQEQHQ